MLSELLSTDDTNESNGNVHTADTITNRANVVKSADISETTIPSNDNVDERSWSCHSINEDKECEESSTMALLVDTPTTVSTITTTTLAPTAKTDVGDDDDDDRVDSTIKRSVNDDRGHRRDIRDDRYPREFSKGGNYDRHSNRPQRDRPYTRTDGPPAHYNRRPHYNINTRGRDRGRSHSRSHSRSRSKSRSRSNPRSGVNRYNNGYRHNVKNIRNPYHKTNGPDLRDSLDMRGRNPDIQLKEGNQPQQHQRQPPPPPPPPSGPHNYNQNHPPPYQQHPHHYQQPPPYQQQQQPGNPNDTTQQYNHQQQYYYQQPYPYQQPTNQQYWGYPPSQQQQQYPGGGHVNYQTHTDHHGPNHQSSPNYHQGPPPHYAQPQLNTQYPPVPPQQQQQPYHRPYQSTQYSKNNTNKRKFEESIREDRSNPRVQRNRFTNNNNNNNNTDNATSNTLPLLTATVEVNDNQPNKTRRVVYLAQNQGTTTPGDVIPSRKERFTMKEKEASSAVAAVNLPPLPPQNPEVLPIDDKSNNKNKDVGKTNKNRGKRVVTLVKK